MCLIDSSEIEESLKIALFSYSQPTALLVYKSHIEHYLNGNDLSCEKMNEFAQDLDKCHQMQQEEQLADSLIDQALHEIEHHDWKSSVSHLQQAATIESQLTKIGA